MESSREGYKAKQEGGNEISNNNNNNNININIEKFSKASSSSSRQWSSSSTSSGFRNPRIVRVSTSFGGKDRHSKVCTIRGLRDRRIRLSIPTAIQLYDLQDKLGLNQPSKVIDWLLEVTKFDIDKLPPLQFPPSFSQFPHHHHQQQTLLPFCSGLDLGPSIRLPKSNIFHHESSTSSSTSHDLSLGVGTFCDTSSTFMGIHQNLMMAKSRFWDVDSLTRGKGKLEAEKGKWIKRNDEENQDVDEEEVGGSGSGNYNNNINTQKLFPMGNHSTLLSHGFLNNNNNNNNNNNVMSSFNNYHSETSNLSLSQFGSHGLFHSQQLDPSLLLHNGLQFQVQPSFSLPPPSSSSSSSSTSQLFFAQSSNNTQTPSSLLGTTTIPFVENNDPRIQIFNHFQFINSSPSSSSQGIPPPSHHHQHHHIPSFNPFNSSMRPFTSTPFSSKLLDSDNNNNNRNHVPDNTMGSGSS